MIPFRILISCSALVIASDDTCDRDNTECHVKHTNNIIDVSKKLADIEKLQHGNINRAYEEIKNLYTGHKEEPEVLFLFSKIQMTLYEKLHVKMRDVGKLELLYPSIENLKTVLRMPREIVSDEFHAEVADFASLSALASSNKTLSVELLDAVLERKGNSVIGIKYK